MTKATFEQRLDKHRELEDRKHPELNRSAEFYVNAYSRKVHKVKERVNGNTNYSFSVDEIGSADLLTKLGLLVIIILNEDGRKVLWSRIRQRMPEHPLTYQVITL